MEPASLTTSDRTSKEGAIGSYSESSKSAITCSLPMILIHPLNVIIYFIHMTIGSAIFRQQSKYKKNSNIFYSYYLKKKCCYKIIFQYLSAL